MKNLRKQFERFCLRNRDKGIPNLMLYICIGCGIVYLISLANGGAALYDLLIFDRSKILQGQVWRLFSYVFTYSIGGNPILVLVSLFCFYSLGRSIENLWGTFRFNLFYLSGIVMMDLFAMFFTPSEPVPFTYEGMEYLLAPDFFSQFYASRMVYYLHLTLLISFATLYPDARFMILYLIPVKAWFLAVVYLVLNAIEIFNLCVPVFMFPLCLFPLVGFANYILFFGKDIGNLIPWQARVHRRSMNRQTASGRGPIPFRTGNHAASAPKKEAYNHRCVICGRTDVSDPDLEFRYCSRCNGYHCYCQDHINDHTHIQ